MDPFLAKAKPKPRIFREISKVPRSKGHGYPGDFQRAQIGAGKPALSKTVYQERIKMSRRPFRASKNVLCCHPRPNAEWLNL